MVQLKVETRHVILHPTRIPKILSMTCLFVSNKEQDGCTFKSRVAFQVKNSHFFEGDSIQLMHYRRDYCPDTLKSSFSIVLSLIKTLAFTRLKCPEICILHLIISGNSFYDTMFASARFLIFLVLTF